MVYPSWCGLHLNNAQFVTRGPGAGQYFSTSGVMNQVTVVDTRDGDATGWSATGIAGTFSDGAGDTFVSKTLGWVPRVSDYTGPFDNGNGTVYTHDPLLARGSTRLRTAPTDGSASSGRWPPRCTVSASRSSMPGSTCSSPSRPTPVSTSRR